MPTPIRIGPAQGYLYESSLDPLFERFVAGMEACSCPQDVGAELLFDHGVRRAFRLGERVIKYYGAGHSRDLLRPSPAVRAANAYAKLLPIRSPKPELAVEIRQGLKLRRSLIVCEFVAGPLLGEAWGKLPEVVESLGPFLAEMHERNIYHGAMKWDHLIWNRDQWVVIDTESLRHTLRKLRPRQLAQRQWASLAMDLGVSDALREAFESYLKARRLDWDPGTTWSHIVELSGEMIAGRRRR